jgi:N-methylhydantoinase A/oxoprolinase/acetone carboxylase beta subunit
VDKIEVAVDKVKTAPGPVPVVSVGGGSVILPETLKGAAAVYRPEHYEVANAIGAAIARVSGQVERIAVLDQTGREQTLAGAVELAKAEAVKAGANPETLSVVDIEDIPMAYLPGNAVNIRVKVAGDLHGQENGDSRGE